ncbi:MarR family winged helix-turn-helix transcriptional regulator [Pseudomonas sp. 5P_3.1_Bac2]|uniref:MarR family winged helix-turn-helix transcriptional regulator n=1 Tax=Pseudomonas sp. 5P_3.1_Bac2 TaxID=2971617 RepID=UPI0021C86F94|nr:MarR family transcriptional regulator [Pseudomonas sp. 5P_3.1_Bac2]MCU1717831.1 MarR family transcriptional regulator [Pseudomonas sp. 5P_3.1_Bac2]
MQTISSEASDSFDSRARSRFGLLVAGVYRQWRRQVELHFKQLDLTDATRTPLLALYDHGQPLRQKDLAEALGLDTSSLVRVLAQLVERGLLQWQYDGHDRRAKCYSLTAEGLATAQVIVEKSLQIEQMILADLSAEELAVTRRALSKINQRFTQL